MSEERDRAAHNRKCVRSNLERSILQLCSLTRTGAKISIIDEVWRDIQEILDVLFQELESEREEDG